MLYGDLIEKGVSGGGGGGGGGGGRGGHVIWNQYNELLSTKRKLTTVSSLLSSSL